MIFVEWANSALSYPKITIISSPWFLTTDHSWEISHFLSVTQGVVMSHKPLPSSEGSMPPAYIESRNDPTARKIHQYSSSFIFFSLLIMMFYTMFFSRFVKFLSNVEIFLFYNMNTCYTPLLIWPENGALEKRMKFKGTILKWYWCPHGPTLCVDGFLDLQRQSWLVSSQFIT